MIKEKVRISLLFIKYKGEYKMTNIKLNSNCKSKNEIKLGTWFKKDDEIVVINLFSHYLSLMYEEDINNSRGTRISVYFISIIKSPTYLNGGDKFDRVFHTPEEAYDFLIKKGYTPIKSIELDITK